MSNNTQIEPNYAPRKIRLLGDSQVNTNSNIIYVYTGSDDPQIVDKCFKSLEFVIPFTKQTLNQRFEIIK